MIFIGIDHDTIKGFLQIVREFVLKRKVETVQTKAQKQEQYEELQKELKKPKDDLAEAYKIAKTQNLKFEQAKNQLEQLEKLHCLVEEQRAESAAKDIEIKNLKRKLQEEQRASRSFRSAVAEIKSNCGKQVFEFNDKLNKIKEILLQCRR